jgi:hypothetical protein
MSAAFPDDWRWPEPISFHSGGFSYVAEIFPPHSRQNNSEKPICYFYKMAYPGTEWKIKPELVWKAKLNNARMPVQALVSMDGELVTLNEHGKAGFENAVVIYDRKGQLLKSFHLDELITNEDEGRFSISTSSRWWNDKARYYFLKNPSRLYILLKWGKVWEFSLTDDGFRTGELTQFADLALVSKAPHADEEAEIWEINLRFSSITDVLNPKIGAEK